MKRISLFLVALLISCSGLMAQTTQTKASDRTTVETKVKKDGTPDKRYKANKTTTTTTTSASATTGPVKKDGTPDKRYKANKTTTTTKTTVK